MAPLLSCFGRNDEDNKDDEPPEDADVPSPPMPPKPKPKREEEEEEDAAAKGDGENASAKPSGAVGAPVAVASRDRRCAAVRTTLSATAPTLIFVVLLCSLSAEKLEMQCNGRKFKMAS